MCLSHFHRVGFFLSHPLNQKSSSTLLGATVFIMCKAKPKKPPAAPVAKSAQAPPPPPAGNSAKQPEKEAEAKKEKTKRSEVKEPENNDKEAGKSVQKKEKEKEKEKEKMEDTFDAMQPKAQEADRKKEVRKWMGSIREILNVSVGW